MPKAMYTSLTEAKLDPREHPEYGVDANITTWGEAPSTQGFAKGIEYVFSETMDTVTDTAEAVSNMEIPDHMKHFIQMKLGEIEEQTVLSAENFNMFVTQIIPDILEEEDDYQIQAELANKDLKRRQAATPASPIKKAKKRRLQVSAGSPFFDLTCDTEPQESRYFSWDVSPPVVDLTCDEPESENHLRYLLDQLTPTTELVRQNSMEEMF